MSAYASNLEIIPILTDAPPLPAGDHSSAIEPAEKRSEMPMPRDWKSFAMTAILVLLVLVILYFSGEVVLAG